MNKGYESIDRHGHNIYYLYMSELKWHWFYPKAFWSVMVGVAGVMLAHFRRKKWL